MKKRILLAVLGILVIVAVLAGIKALQIRAMIDSGKEFVPPPATVTMTPVKSDTWDTSLSAVGSLTAVQGVTIAAESPGKVMKIAFSSGAPVKKGELLVQQDTRSEEAQLPGAIAQATLARNDLQRADKMFANGIISPSDHDVAVAKSALAEAQIATLRAAIGKKTLRAPFSGRLGIRQVNLGQMLQEGEAIVTLQTLRPIFIDFSLPQQQLARLRSGLPVRISGDALGQEVLTGEITAINPLVDAATRNVQIQATLANQDEKLRPGMFVNVAVGLPARQQVLIIPATAVLYAPYSDSVFVIEKAKEGEGLVLRQQFVHIGEKRGDFVAVIEGLKEGENVVSTGAFKLRNGQAVVVDNQLAPDFQLAPRPGNN